MDNLPMYDKERRILLSENYMANHFKLREKIYKTDK